MSRLVQIRTAQQLQAFIDELPKLPTDATELCGVPLTKRSAELTKDEVSRLNEWAAEHMLAAIVWVDLPMSMAILGAKEVDPALEAPNLQLGKGKGAKHYVCTNNPHNRPFSEGRLGTPTKEGYVYDWLNGLWSVGDPGIIDAQGFIQSLQHRAITCIKANQLAASVLPPVPITLLVGLPPQFGDNLDKAKERKPSDREYRDTEQFTVALLTESLATLPQEATALRKFREECASTIVTVANFVHCRMRGIDVHASKSQLPSERQRLEFRKRFSHVSDDMGEVVGSELERVIARVVAAQYGEDGKKLPWVSTFSPSIVIAGLILASNMEADPANPDSQDTIVDIDSDIVSSTLEYLRTSSGVGEAGFSPAMVEIAKAKSELKKSGGSAPRLPEIMGTFVSAHKQLLANGSITTPTWMAKKDRTKAAKKADKTYRIYGGIDVGYSAPEKDE